MEDAIGIILNQGVLGAVVIILGSVVWYLYRGYRADLREKNQEIGVLQEKRVTDSNTYFNSFVPLSQQLLNQNKDLANLVQNNQKSIETIASILQSMKRR